MPTVEFATVADALGALLPPPLVHSFSREFVETAPFTIDEEAYAARVRPKRLRDFATGRRCALAALAGLGVQIAGLGREPDGRPRWPSGTVGSISHCDGLCLAVVARADAVVALGADVECRKPWPDDVIEEVATPAEAEWLARLGPQQSLTLDTVLFSAKESVFKALYPRVGRFFGFEEVDIMLDVAAGSFAAHLQPRLARDALMPKVAGRFAATTEFIVTAVVVDAAHAAGR